MCTPQTTSWAPVGPLPKAVRQAFVAAVAMLIVNIFTVFSVSVRGQDLKSGRDEEFRPNALVLQRMLRARTNLTVENLPLILAVKKPSETHNILIKLDSDVLTAAGVVLDTPVTTSIRNYTLQAALFHIFGNDDLQFSVTGNVLAVTVAPAKARLQEPVAPPLRPRALGKNNDGAKLAFTFAEGVGPVGRMGVARFNDVTVVCMPVPDADVLDGEAQEQVNAPPGMLQITFNRGDLDTLIFGKERDAAAVQGRLVLQLDWKVKEVDRICGLSDAQKEKLRLAGRGDVKSLLDRAIGIKMRFENTAAIRNINEFEKWARAFSEETEAVRPVLNSGPFDGNSRFAKSLKRTLTLEQSAEYARAVVTER